MAIPRKQIGWSQESNLLWEISNQMDKLTGVVSTSGGGGGGGVQSVTGLNTDNTDPLNPIVEIAVDNNTIQGAGTSGVPLIATGNLHTQCINLGGGTDITITEPGVYRIINANGGYNIIVNVNPTDYRGNKIVFINTDVNNAAPIDTNNSYGLGYQGSNTFLNQINAGSTFEFVSLYENDCQDFNWRTNATTRVVAQSELRLVEGGNPANLYVGVDGGGFYTIRVANDELSLGGLIYFPSPGAYIGHRIVIMNRDQEYDANISDDGNAPVDINNSTILTISASTVREFISTGNYWYMLSSRSF